MDEPGFGRWFAAYLADFAALGRGDTDDLTRLLAHYGVPLVLSSDAGSVVLTDEERVLAAVGRQVEALRAAGYDRSEELSAVTTVVNRTCVLHRAAFTRVRADGSAIGRVETTYVVVEGPAGRRIVALLVHAAA
ncbi:hypothetical protein SAMN04488107_0202 [Geodermatophilus saharensis]|uniref:DUF6841 domain-containing protein n=1 Tax=Geodermatophilus saharensis TaxID=1137994 RepID=A0A238ZN18_9ACTN|nr:hypothetical protein [Geodermatophilus saharensis]SNR84846.1 hypothetical protein SAMN04488107_0202 [Geodermatophilus saharensis]